MGDLLHLVRFTLETASPLSAASGEAGIFDVALARDANGLPQIGGASLQGVLRHLHDEVHGVAATNSLFGFAEYKTGQAGRLTCSFGAVHDSSDNAVIGLRNDAPDFDDDLLRALAAEAPLIREHVALNCRHVADGRAKFDRAALPRGTRFSFEIALWGDIGNDRRDCVRLRQLLRLVGHPGFRIGGGARRGYGRTKLIWAGYCSCLVASTEDVTKLRDLRDRPPSDKRDLTDITDQIRAGAAPGLTTASFTLIPVGVWRVGSTGVPLRAGQYEMCENSLIDRDRGGPEPREKDADAVPIREPWIEWRDGRGTLVEQNATEYCLFAVPGSAIKGPLAHRTAFHWNRLEGGDRMIEVDEWLRLESKDRAQRIAAVAGRPDRLQSLFGAAKEKADTERGRAARLIVDDSIVQPRYVGAIDHNSIDRFTGGVRNRLLFSEEVVLGGEMQISLTILPPRGGSVEEASVQKAFCAALRDLAAGRLALGAKSLGFCKLAGDIAWCGPAAATWKQAWEQSS